MAVSIADFELPASEEHLMLLWELGCVDAGMAKGFIPGQRIPENIVDREGIQMVARYGEYQGDDPDFQDATLAYYRADPKRYGDVNERELEVRIAGQLVANIGCTAISTYERAPRKGREINPKKYGAMIHVVSNALWYPHRIHSKAL